MRTYPIWIAFMTACGSTITGQPAALSSLPESDTAYCVALGADYMNDVGSLSILGLPSLTLVKNLLPGTVSGDPVVRSYGDKLYVVNRNVANVTIIDTETWTVERQFSTGAGTNPQDIALVGGKAYIPLYAMSKGLLVWDLSKPDREAGETIDLSSYDPDGVPNANSVAIAGGKVYVTLDLLDEKSKARGKGKVVVLDPQTNTVVTAFETAFPNPYGFIFPRGNTLLVPSLSTFTDDDGCLEQIATGATPGNAGCLVAADAFKGKIGTIATTSTVTYLTISEFDADFNEVSSLRRVGADGLLEAGSLTPPGQVPSDVAVAPTGHLVYNDVTAGGLRVYDVAQQKELTIAALPLGLSPARSNAIVCLPR